MLLIIGLIVAGLVISYVLYQAHGMRGVDPDWNVGGVENDGETTGFQTDWAQYKEKRPTDSGPGWDS
jgi:hypothetical protein